MSSIFYPHAMVAVAVMWVILMNLDYFHLGACVHNLRPRDMRRRRRVRTAIWVAMVLMLLYLLAYMGTIALQAILPVH